MSTKPLSSEPRLARLMKLRTIHLLRAEITRLRLADLERRARQAQGLALLKPQGE